MTTVPQRNRPHARASRADAPRIRRSREELRELLLEAGREVLLTDGLGSGAEHLTFKRVLSHVADSRGIRVTNASVIGRIWDNQEDFQTDVVRSLVEDRGDEEVEDTSTVLLDVLGRLDVSTPELRRASLSELIRVSCAEYLRTASTSSATIQTALVTYVAAAHRTRGDPEVVTWFRETNDRLTRKYTELYELGLAAVGYRVRPHLSLHDASVALSAFAEGILLRQAVEPDAFNCIVRVRALDGVPVEWTVFALAMDALADFFTEPDPDWAG